MAVPPLATSYHLYTNEVFALLTLRVAAVPEQITALSAMGVIGKGCTVIFIMLDSSPQKLL
jgi:hypothetical protein